MKRFFLPLGATFVLGLSFAAACGEDAGANACEKAGQRIVDRYEECEFEVQGGGGDGGGSAECTDAIAAQANCVADCAEEADCAIVRLEFDATDMAMADAAMAYTTCVGECG